MVRAPTDDVYLLVLFLMDRLRFLKASLTEVSLPLSPPPPSLLSLAAPPDLLLRSGSLAEGWILVDGANDNFHFLF